MRRTVEIKKVPVLPVARVALVVFLALGILVGILYAFLFSGLGFLAGMLGGQAASGEMLTIQRLGFVMVPIIAVSYAIFGTIGVVLWTAVYNLAAGAFGGFELVLEDGIRTERTAAPVAGRDNEV